MATLSLSNSTHTLREELAKLDEGGIQGNLIMQHGALHALRFLLKQGGGQRRIESMIGDIEDNLGVIEQVAAERGMNLQIVHQKFSF